LNQTTRRAYDSWRLPPNMSGQVVGQWPLKPLAEVAEIISGQSPKGEFYNDSGDGLPFYQGKKEFREKYIGNPTKWTSKTTKIAYEGDILMSVRAPVGPINFATQEICIGRGLAAIRVSEHMNRDFLFYQLLFKQGEISGKDGAVFPSINRAMIGEIQVVAPPLEEQQRIVSILDEAFSQISVSQKRATANVAAAEELFSSSLHNTFTIVKPNWLESTIDQLAEHRLGKMLDKNKNTGSLRPYLRNKNVRWFEFDLTDVNEMKFEDSERSKYTAIAGDLLICEGGYPGRAAIWNDTEPVYFQKALHRVRFHEKNYTKWFLYYLYYLDLTEGLRKHFTGTGIQHFTGKSLAKMSIPIAPSGEIDSKIMMLEQLHSEVEKLTQLNDDKMAQLTKLKHSLLQEAFNGTL
jgi:type I restriction enzyme, S subunit